MGAYVRIGFGVAGLIGLGALVWSVGPRVVFETLTPALPWLPVIAVLELGRIGSECAATYVALGPARAKIPLPTLFKATLVGLSIGALAPAPRVVNETIKGSVVAPHVGVAAATSAGITMQAATLNCVGLFSIPCGIAIHLLGGDSIWVWASMIHCASMVGSNLAIRAAARAKGLGRWLGKRFPKLGGVPTDVAEHNALTSIWSVKPTLILFINRSTQVAQLAIAAHAVGIDATLPRALAVQGVNNLASAVGVMVPGGFGANDAAYTLSAGLLLTTVVKATTLALLMRCLQLVWLFIGSIVLAFHRRGQRSMLVESPVTRVEEPDGDRSQNRAETGVAVRASDRRDDVDLGVEPSVDSARG